MKQSDFIQKITHNWPVKALSLILAIFVYLVVLFTTGGQKVVVVPLTVLEPEAFVAVSTIPDSVEITIRGDERTVNLLDVTVLHAVADFSGVAQEGVASVPVLLSPTKFPLIGEINLAVNPQVIKVSFVAKELSVDIEALAAPKE